MLQKATFKTSRMVPLNCISSTEGRLLKLPGVRNASIDGQTNQIIVTYNSPEVSRVMLEKVFEECEFELVDSTEDYYERVLQRR